MTAKKQSLLDKGVILHDYADTELLLSRDNVDQEALLNYAREAADFSTQQQLPSLDFAINHYGQPDVAMFDFTCMYASENAALVRELHGHQLLVALVGDSLLEPFWPMGTGIARGFLAAMDSAWMVRSWSLGATPLEVLAERESIYRLLPQTTPENVSKNFSQYSIDPVTRYPNININFLQPSQVRHLYDSGEARDIHLELEGLAHPRATPKLARHESVPRSNKLLSWCQRQTEGYAGVSVTDLTVSWKSGLALCALLHRYRPDLIDFDSLEEQNVEKNNQLAFDIAEKELGICPIMTGKEMASVGEPDQLSMVMYLTQFYEMFRDSLSSRDAAALNAEEKAVLVASTKSPISFLSKLGQTISRKRSPKDKKEKDSDGAGKRRKTSQSEEEEVPRGCRGGRPALGSALTDRRTDVALGNQNKVKYMATQLLAKFEENAPAQSSGLRRQGSMKKEFPQNLGGSDTCYFCQKRVYVMERLSAEGKFFHRSCFKCEYCATTLRLSAYAYDIEDGKFYCKPHYCYRLSGSAQRKRPAVTALSGKDARAPLQEGPVADASGRASGAAGPAERTPGSSVNGLEEPSIAKRLRGTPERIELENCRLSVQPAAELQEVPEETQAEHNLSSVLDKGLEDDAASSSSESEMEEEEDDEEEPAPLPICSQPQPSCEAAVPSPTLSPICFQPGPAKTSTPLAPVPVKSQGDAQDRLGSPLAADEALRRSDLVAEFWTKSAEIRRSLGLTPVERGKAPELGFPSPSLKPVSLKAYSVEKSPQGEGLPLLKAPPVPKRLGLPPSEGDQPCLPTPKSPSDREPRSAQEERRDLSSSSGLGLHGSSSNTKTLGSQSFNTSDSTMLTPPSSPPPPPPQGEEPATLRRKPPQMPEPQEAEPKASGVPPPPAATALRPPREPAQPPREEVRKSFVESVDDIPFADDVEDTYEDRTEDSSLQEKFFTPPSGPPLSEKPLRPPVAKENGRLPSLESGVHLQKRGLPVVSPEAKERAEERMRARERSVKSQALRDAMATQLRRMKEMETAAKASRPPGGPGRKPSSGPPKGRVPGLASHRVPEEPTAKHKAASEEALSPASDSGPPDGSLTSSEGSSGKSKKRASLFSPRRAKGGAAKAGGRPPGEPGARLAEEAAPKPRSLWKSVFSGYKKDKKKKGDHKSCPSTPSSGATVDSGTHRASPRLKAELQLRRQLSFSEDSDLSSDDVLESASQRSKREPRTYTEEELSAKLTRRVQKAARRQAKQEELKRLHRAQIIQRQLEQVEERQRHLEERGVAVEKALRGEAGMGKKDDPKLMQEWFRLVQEKNAMVRYESELMIFARELELEDRQSRLQQELRERMAVEDHLKTEEELSDEKRILNEMLEVVEQRDALVALLEEQRLREKEEDRDLEAAMLSKGFSLNWS
ncbi:microtubule associated monooxygenase, calponin and LIM domain containing 3 [Phyllostomus discolor]|uniref:F-actin monooxygenase n=1 Tax=Phyllostomus discolor TaxID=89673 RepID=A0A833YYC0_9CHIR|nr:microtubule associated monooxygenase, calponin and LIM domain containing 3 [Phyllostomus discolor]